MQNRFIGAVQFAAAAIGLAIVAVAGVIFVLALALVRALVRALPLIVAGAVLYVALR